MTSKSTKKTGEYIKIGKNKYTLSDLQTFSSLHYIYKPTPSVCYKTNDYGKISKF